MKFKDFYDMIVEQDSTAPTNNNTNIEDMSPESLKATANVMTRVSKLKSSGNEKAAIALTIKELQSKLRTTTDFKTRAGIQKRIRDLQMKQRSQGAHI